MFESHGYSLKLYISNWIPAAFRHHQNIFQLPNLVAVSSRFERFCINLSDCAKREKHEFCNIP